MFVNRAHFKNQEECRLWEVQGHYRRPLQGIIIYFSSNISLVIYWEKFVTDIAQLGTSEYIVITKGTLSKQRYICEYICNGSILLKKYVGFNKKLNN